MINILHIKSHNIHFLHQHHRHEHEPHRSCSHKHCELKLLSYLPTLLMGLGTLV